MSRLKIVLDTNVFLVSLAEHYKYHWIFQSLIEGKYELCVSTEILLEYQEQISIRYGLSKTDVTLDFILLLPNVNLVTPYYNWEAIQIDKDDNKFVDTAIAGNVDFIVSNDKHFKILDKLDFPSVRRIKAEEFTIKYKTIIEKQE